MRLNSKKVLLLMEERGLLEDMLHAVVGLGNVRGNRYVSLAHARRLAKVLDATLKDIISEGLGEV